MTSVLNVQYNDFDQTVASSTKIIHMVMLQCLNKKLEKLLFHRYIQTKKQNKKKATIVAFMNGSEWFNCS